MNKTAIKNFAIWARNKLRADIILKAGLLGITEKEIANPLPQSTDDLQIFDIGTSQPVQLSGKTAIEQRKSLVAAIRAKNLKHSEAFDAVIEEVAYTWFNRLIAVRFMEVNDYLPSRVRVLSSENPAKAEPDFVTKPFDTDLDFTEDEINLIDNLKDNNKSDELFQFLFIKQCNKLNEILPELFEKTNDYTELLLNVSFTDKDGVVYHLVHDISEDDFNIGDDGDGQVEMIGWLYQFYNDERKNEVINIKKSIVNKKDIPAATQLFTTDWVVRYIVDNSLGRYWIERNPESKLKEKLDYLVLPKDGKINYIDENIEPQEIKLLDPCMGSAHFLVYAFDVFMAIYEERGYSQRDAAILIAENNLFGLEIDKRAYQLSYFALMMKVRRYNRRALRKENRINLNIAYIRPTDYNTDFVNLYSETCKTIAEKVLNDFKYGDELGSIIQPSFSIDELSILKEETEKILDNYYNNIFDTARQGMLRTDFIPVLKQAEIIVGKYEVVATNPPFMNKMDKNLKNYVNDNYKDYSGDMFSVFIYRNFGFCKMNGYSGFMSPYVWMFIKTYEKLRSYILSNKSITTLVQMEYSAFEEATVPICTFALKNAKTNEKGSYFRLTEFKGGMKVQEEKVIEALRNPDCGYYYEANAENFSKIPGSPIAYWWENYNIFDMVKISSFYESAGRNKTHDNTKYVRYWWEVSNMTKWQPYANGGVFRRWSGNDVDVVDWSDEAKINYASHGGLYNQKYNGIRGICWNLITSYKNGFRLKHEKHHYSSGSPTIISINNNMDYYVLAFLNSIVASSILSMLNPTLNTTVNDVLSLPLITSRKECVENVSYSNTLISQRDWDSFETSWDFKRHPLVVGSGQCLVDRTNHSSLITNHYKAWESECLERFNKLKANEEELNRIFIEIYGLQDELTPDVADKDITVHRVFDSKDDVPESMKGSSYIRTKRDEVVSLISYAVGCMFGRYSLDKEGLIFAGGNFNDTFIEDALYPSDTLYPSDNLFPKEPEYSKLKTDDGEIDLSFYPDYDNCIPITDTKYFDDDIVGRFEEFIKAVYGSNTLEQNLDFIAKALGTKGNTSRDVIRNYFLNDFFKDHCKIYQKRPIYWLFDSGKQNGFKALCYMHRWNADTIGNMRVEYLHRIQRTYEKEIEREQDTIDNTTNNRDKAAAIKRKEKLLKQLKEAKDYDAKVAHLALSRPDIDLDDGVKVNYEKVQTAQDGKKLQILAKI